METKISVGVVAGRFEIAKEFVDILVGDITLKNFSHFVESRRRYEVHLKNGSVYRALVASENLRGLRFDKLFVHIRTVEKEFVTNVLPPVFTKGEREERWANRQYNER